MFACLGPFYVRGARPIFVRPGSRPSRNFLRASLLSLQAGGSCSSFKEGPMEHRRRADLTHVADLKPMARTPVMSRRERLDRWAELLEKTPDRFVATLEETEWAPADERRSLRADGSALTI